MLFESCVAVCIVLIYWYCNLRRPCPHQTIRFASSLPSPSLPQPNDSESQPSRETKADATIKTKAKNPTKREEEDENSENRSTFDYVVVGGGPAGFAAAVTLLLSSSQAGDASARKDGPVTVALLERGPFTPTGGMPDLFSFTHDLRHGVLDQGSAPQLRPFAATVDATKEDGSGTVDHEDGSDEEGKGSDESSILSSSSLLQQQPYPRGATLGGTQLLDWGVYFAPAPLGDDQPYDARVLALAKQQTSFAVCRSPLSWGAAESAGQHERLTKALPAVSAGDETNPDWAQAHNNHKKATKKTGDEEGKNETNRGTVQPLQIWMDPNTGVRHHLHRHWYDLLRSATTHHHQEQQHLHVYRNATVLDFVREGAACVGVRARCISPSPNARTVCLFRVRKGVILCAGAMQTPWLAAKLLRNVGLGADSPHHHNNSNKTNNSISVPWNDSIGVPLVYEARPGMSDDAVNVHRSLKSIAAWYLARRGPFLNVVTDTMMEFPSDIVPGAVVRIFVLPAAGFHRLRFQKLGLDVHLGLFEEAMMFWVTVAKFPSSCLLTEDRSITTLRYSTSSSTIGEDDAARGESVPVAHIQPLRDPAVRTQVRQVLREGLSVCRDIAQVAPLRQLISGREAVDISLFPEASQRVTMKALYADLLARSQQKGSGQTTGLASLLTQRRATRSMNPPPTSAGAAAQFSPQEITAAREEAVRVVHSEQYMDAYIEKHSQWMGFGSGSSSLLVRRGENGNNRLKEVSNVWIGDASAVAVPSTTLSQSSTSNCESGTAEEGQQVFESGGVMTAMMCGAVAARSAALLGE